VSGPSGTVSGMDASVYIQSPNDFKWDTERLRSNAP
jgi:hypothetical protein